MADARTQINPQVTIATKALLQQYCQDKRTTQSDVVDAALQAFLQPQGTEDLAVAQMGILRAIADQIETLEARHVTLEQGMAAMIPLLTTIVEKLETPPEPKAAAVPIADYGQLYPGLCLQDQRGERKADEEAFGEEPPTLPERKGWFFPRKATP